MAGQDRSTLLRAQTAIEELFANSVTYGNYAQDPHASIWLSAWMDNTGLGLSFEDAFAPFNPFQGLDKVLLETGKAIEQRAIGGLGRLMVFELADEASYTYNEGHNCVRLFFSFNRD